MLRSLLAKLRFYLTVGIFGAATLGFVTYTNNLQFTTRHVAAQVPLQSAPQSTPASAKRISGKPIRIVIPGYNLDLKVADGTYNPSDSSWSFQDNAVQYATITPPPNDHAGNTLLYGHDSWEIFGHIRHLQPGDQAIVYTDNKHKFTYVFDSATDVKPDDVSVLRPSVKPILTLQTCTGSWNELRRLSMFNLTGVDQP